VQRDVAGVVRLGAVALDADVGADRLGKPEQQHGLVEEVWAQIEPHARAGQRLLPPSARFQLGPEPVEMRLVAHDSAQHTVRHHILRRDKVAGVAALLIDRQDASSLARELNELSGLSEGCRKRLVDDDVPPCREALLGNRMVARVRRGDDDHVERPAEQLVDARHEVHIGIARVRRPVALDDGRQPETRDRAKDRRVEYLAGEAEADHSDVEHGG